ncbi:hypothetical protein BDFB_000156 [Asbolus verrucosus]|uniref:Uncharacterized protein n=1 Tax=Asbolus verrucosus TaxID=1661398 RepID=A0A482VVP4_ASBVE|nr:hypothetical protein BDFB_000156 [Asbolus verrucosus]
MLDVKLLITVQFAVVNQDILVILSLDVIQYHVRKLTPSRTSPSSYKSLSTISMWTFVDLSRH